MRNALLYADVKCSAATVLTITAGTVAVEYPVVSATVNLTDARTFPPPYLIAPTGAVIAVSQTGSATCRILNEALTAR
jgi:hypothetical protein